MEYQIKRDFTCPYIGSRNGGNKVIFSNLTLKEAHKKMLELYNELFDNYANNWGIAVRQSSKTFDGAKKTQKDGIREIRYDSRIYKIEKVNN
jgi:hypothetical protein